MHIDTELQNFDACPGDPHRPTSTPIYQTATFEQPASGEGTGYDYTRSGNPTRHVLETQLARLERGDRAFAFASGMAALSAVTRLASAGDEVLAGEDLYGGTYRLLSKLLTRQGMKVHWVDTTDLDAVRAALSPRTRMLLMETPTNPFQKVSNLAALSEIMHRNGSLLAVDNSLASPCLQRPLQLGADLVVHSATKFLGGHGDLTAGVVATSNREVADELAFVQNAEGNGLSPFECWLLLRGLRTFSLRVERQQANAMRLAEFLAAHPVVTAVHYPGLPEHPGHALHLRQAKGAGSLISFETGSLAISKHVVAQTTLFTTAVSFGCVGSVISLPGSMSHASIPAEVRRSRAFPEDLLRISAGIEDVDDLIEDLGLALAGHGSKVRVAASSELPGVSAVPAERLT